MSTSPIRMSSPRHSSSTTSITTQNQEVTSNNLTPPDSESSELDSTETATMKTKLVATAERPSLHSYTSFEATFDLHPPPSPPPSPKTLLTQEGGKGWWRV